MHHLNGKRVAILATHGFEQSELEVPLQCLKEQGATVHVVSESGEIRARETEDWGRPVKVDVKLDSAHADDYDAIVLPGGLIRTSLIRAFYDQKKVVAARFAMLPGY
jgi:protease I